MAANRRRQRAMRPRDYPGVAAMLTRAHMRDEQRAAMDAANYYTRPSLRLAFQAGWQAGTDLEQVCRMVAAPLMSDLGKGAYWRGAEARQHYETTNERRNDGQTP